MPILVVTTREGDERRIDVGDGRSVMQAIRGGGLDELLAICGGCCSCATCHVYVEQTFRDRLPAMSADEDDLLDGSSFRNVASRLSCQVPFTPDLDGLRVTIAPAD